MPLSHDPGDRLIVEAQLGRTARGDWAVAARCHLGLPMVIENHPRLDDGTPFPTLYWLTCPMLVKNVSKLEASGTMAEINGKLAADPGARDRLGAALTSYKESRDRHEVVADAGAPPGGGPDRVKCLHAHVAHELVSGINPVGAIALELTGWPDCLVPCVAAAE